MSSAILSVGDLRVFHDETEVVHGVSFEIPPDSVTGIIGVNGAGKTATALAIAGLLRSTGKIVFNGSPIEPLTPWTRSHGGIALVQEGRRLFHGLTVAENLGLASWRRGRTRSEIARQIELIHDLFPVLKRKQNDPASRLSGGEQQMLAVGQGLMTFPKLIILDEPTAGLAPKIVGEMLQVIGRLSREGYTAIIVDQSVSNVRSVAQRAIIMRLGHVVRSLNVDALNDTVVAEFLT